ncbi:MAG TPA: zinc ribbon domain-containing protein [Pyrinomonadaceae bacterium]|jgi:hypothetical protein
MYCPQCGTDNLDNASFCRGCGSNISLVPQALTGSLPTSVPDETDDDDDKGRRRKKGRKGPPSIERGIKNVFSGLAFLFVALSIRYFMPGGFAWWFWMLIPAFSMLGGGVAEIVRFNVERASAPPAVPPTGARPLNPLPPRRASALPQRNTAELIPQPPSITEGTTRHLGAEMPTRHLETPVESKPNDV